MKVQTLRDTSVFVFHRSIQNDTILLRAPTISCCSRFMMALMCPRLWIMYPIHLPLVYIR